MFVMNQKIPFEPFRIKTVERFNVTTPQEREKYLQEAHHNLFLLRSEQVMIDLLTDSGTSAMSTEQWGRLMEGDESYAGARSWEKLRSAIYDLTQFPHILPVHQGRAAERILYGRLAREGEFFISNTHFDTTRANIEAAEAQAIDCPVEKALKPETPGPFKGNLDIEKLQYWLQQYPQQVAGIIITLTNNTGGGQPASLNNIQRVRKLCDEYEVPLVVDACRIAENAYFIQQRETAYRNHSISQIAREIFDYADAAIMSAKKDGLVNMGGFLALRDDQWAEDCQNTLIVTEGYKTYGGMSGRTMETFAQGLNEVFDPHYLAYRIGQVKYLAEELKKIGVPVMEPAGGHAVYIDAKTFLDHLPPDHFPGQVLVNALYLEGGIRGVEVGSVMFGKYNDNGDLQPPPLELARLAIPRRVYTKSHLDYVVNCFKNIRSYASQLKGLSITYEPKALRHFTARFEKVR